MELNKAHYHLKLEQPELMRVGKYGMYYLRVKARKHCLKMSYLQFCETYEEDVKLTRQSYVIAGELDLFNMYMEEIEKMFKRGDKRNETIAIIGRSKRV